MAMVTDAVYELCLPILKDDNIEEEEKTDKLEELLRKETTLVGRPLEDAILGVLWRHRDSTASAAAAVAATQSPQPRNALVAHRASPAPWQIGRASTPVASPSLTGASPASSHGFAAIPPAFTRAKSSTASPFTSPRPSPRLAFTSPIPHSPNLNSYEFSETTATQGDYGDYGSDTVDWLVNDDSTSRPTSSGAGSAFESNLSGAAPAWVQPQQSEMSPYDMLRSVLGESKTDEEIEYALQQNNYDLSATIAAFMSDQAMFEDQATIQNNEGQVLVGKSMLSSQPIPIGQQSAQGRSNVICKYWLSTGSCLRADCRFSHDFGSQVCRYWVMGNCLAGDTCVFSHDPTTLMANMNIASGNNADGTGNNQPSFQVQDYDFPALQTAVMNQIAQNQLGGQSYSSNSSNRAMAASALSSHVYNSSSPRSFGSRPTSRHSSRAPTPSLPQVDDTDAFPTLGTANVKAGKKHHGKRGGHGHGHQNKENQSGSMAEVVRMSPGPAPGLLRKGLMKSRVYTGNKETNAAANAIPAPEHIPWLENDEKANQAYIKARQDAFKHGGLRNKFLQSAAQAWNRNDARAAKALSLRGQSENDLMRKAHREAARHLYESRIKPLDDEAKPSTSELYVDLHGLHPEEAVSYLARILREQRTSIRPVYAITGTGHHSKGGKDKVGKAVRMWLGGRGIAFREFSVPGDRGNVGGILGIDARTGDVGSASDEKGEAEGISEKEGKEEKGTEDESEGKETEKNLETIEPAQAVEKPAVTIPKGPRMKAL